MMTHLQISDKFSFKLIPASNLHIPYQQIMDSNYVTHNPEYKQINIFFCELNQHINVHAI
jgi:hypothetical protein